MDADALYRHLLVSGLLLEEGAVRPQALAEALERTLGRGERALDLRTALDGRDDLADNVLQHGEALRDRAGSWREAFVASGGADRVAALGPHAGPNLRRVLLEMGVPVGTALRPMGTGRYQDFVPVGKGGMGIVYWALDAELNREVAVKVIHPAAPGTAGDVTPISPAEMRWPPHGSEDGTPAGQLEARFLQEAWITGSMTHPGIVPVYELGRTEAGVPYYTMRFIEGRRTLADAIDEVREQPLDQRLVLLDVFLSVCDPIRYAHSRGVLHRDLKPSNVVLGEYGDVVVVDWGLARVRDRPDSTRAVFLERIEALREATDLRTVQGVLGTPGYLSPEAASGDVDGYAEAGDVYSLATVLFEILTGRLPIPVETTRQYLSDVQARAAPDARTIDPDVPAPLAALCARGLEKDPVARIARVADLADGVRRWRREAAKELELEALRREAETALVAAGAAVGAAALPELERASHAGRRMLELREGDGDARRLLDEVDAARAVRVAGLEGAARRRLLRRVAAAAVLVTAVSAVVVAVVLEKRRQEAADARASAAASRDRAEGVMTFMVGDLLDDLEPIGRLDLLVRTGARAREYYAALPPEEASETSLENRSVALRRLGDAFRVRGDLTEALAAYEASRRSAAELARRDGASSGRFQEVLARAAIGEALFLQGYTTRAREILESSQVALHDLARDRADDAELLTARSDVDARLASIVLTEGRWSDAVDLGREALRGAERAAAMGEDAGSRRTVLQRRLDLADVEYGPDRSRVVEEMREVLDTVHALAVASPDDLRWAELEAQGRLRLARLLLALDRTREAGAAAELASVTLEALVLRDPANLSWTSSLASAHRAEGDILVSDGSFSGAQALYREAYDSMRVLSRDDPSNANWLNQLIILCDRLVLTGVRLGETAEHIDGWRDDAVGYARQLLARDPDNAKHRHILAYTIHQQGSRALVEGNVESGLDLTAESRRLIHELLEANPHNEEAAVLLSWNTLAEMPHMDRATAVAAGEETIRVLEGVLAHRPDFWRTRKAVTTVELQLAQRLLEESPPLQERADELLEAAEASLRAGLAHPDISDGGRHRFEQALERVRELQSRSAPGR